MTPLARGEVRLVPLTVPQHERLTLVSDAAHARAQDPAIVAVCNTLKGAADNVRASEALRYVQAFRREFDPEGADVVADPIATLERRVGDCLSLSGLLVAILRACAIRSALAAIKRPCDVQDHVAVLVSLARGMRWADPISFLPLGRVTQGIECPLPETVTLW